MISVPCPELCFSPTGRGGGCKGGAGCGGGALRSCLSETGYRGSEARLRRQRHCRRDLHRLLTRFSLTHLFFHFHIDVSKRLSKTECEDFQLNKSPNLVSDATCLFLLEKHAYIIIKLLLKHFNTNQRTSAVSHTAQYAPSQTSHQTTNPIHNTTRCFSNLALMSPWF